MPVRSASSALDELVVHPGDVKTEMWAAIHDEAAALGPAADDYRRWVEWVDQTGGDAPQKAADLVLRLVLGQAGGITGRFLWIEDGLQAPLPSWGDDGRVQPWLESVDGRGAD